MAGRQVSAFAGNTIVTALPGKAFPRKSAIAGVGQDRSPIRLSWAGEDFQSLSTSETNDRRSIPQTRD